MHHYAGYTAGLIRLDIAQALDTATRFLDNPNTIAEEFMDNIWLYLKGTKHDGISAQVGIPGPMRILAYSDAEFGHGIPYANSENPKIAAPIIGGVVMIGTMPIIWFAKKNKNVVLSTAEAELMAAIETTKDIIEAIQMLHDMKQNHEKPILHMDAKAAIHWVTKGDRSFRKTRHIGAPYYWLLDQMQEGVMDVEYVGTQDQIADLLTKPLPAPALRHLKQKCMSVGGERRP